MKLNFKVDKEFFEGISRLSSVLGYELGDGITVTAEACDKCGVTLKDGAAVIYYKNKAQFFRGIGLLLENAREKSEFSVFSDTHFDTVSSMVDASRCSVPRVRTVKKLLDYLAAMGYNMMMLYTEDVIKLEGRDYFGYMRGAYTVEELKEIDDYAYEYGIEVVPCLECYGHMEKYLIWPEAAKLADTKSVMLARSEDTFKFVEELIATTSKAFRSRRVHIGMDEAWDMGRGKFLDLHGYVPPFKIFTEFMERLIEITNKYGLRPMMWSDMYFRTCSKSGKGYYQEDIEIPEEVKARIPEEVDLVFWHYGEGPHCDDFMLKKHNALGRPVIFAGGNWGWIGHFPEHNYMMETSRFSINACRNNNVKEAMLTVWCNDNAECDTFANLYSFSYFAELCYNENPGDEEIKKRFEATTGGDFDLFYKMSYYHNDFENGNDYPSYSDRFFGKPLFWQDILGGLYDKRLFDKPMSSHYSFSAELFKGKENKDRWGYLYEYAYRVFDYLATKTEIAERLYPAYHKGDKAALADICDRLIPTLVKKTKSLHEHHRRMWFENNNVIGWQNLDVRYGGVILRCESAILLINDYLDGKIDKIEELEEKRLYKSLSGFAHYSDMATVNLKT